MEITRLQETELMKYLRPGKVTLLLGARRVGKTILLNNFLAKYKRPYLLLNGEDIDTHQMLAHRTVANYTRVLNGNDLLIIDEAQGIPEIGKKLKLMIDCMKGLKILVTGSSVFDILNVSGEPLTGRNIVLYLYPIWQGELKENALQTKQNLDERIVYGSYPELWHYKTLTEKKKYLNDLVHSYLYKDVLALDGLRNSSQINNLLKLVAYQIGKEVSFTELGNIIGMSKNTVEKYLNVLTKVFILYKVTSYSKNLRKEIAKSNRWYFVDNGIRNAIINNFSPLHMRDGNEIGMLWENYLFMERMKRNTYRKDIPEYFFWRTYDRQEIDFVEIRESEVKKNKIKSFEAKFSSTKKAKQPVAFKKAYPASSFSVVNKDNYLSFIL